MFNNMPEAFKKASETFDKEIKNTVLTETQQSTAKIAYLSALVALIDELKK